MNDRERTALLREVRRIVEDGGYEVARIAVGRDRSIHLMLDKAEGRVTVDECSRMNLKIRRDLMAGGVDMDAWSVDVESPGAFRPLTQPRHFMRFLGQRIRVVRRAPDAPHRVIVGALESADLLGIRLAGEVGGVIDLPYTDLADARLEPKLPF